MTIVFGTEGWRAVMADEFTIENVRVVAQAIAEHALETAKGPPSLVVGYDTRLLSDRFAAAVAEVLAGNGICTSVTDRAVPTCAVSRYVVDQRLTCGVMITASHNPAVYNGIKIKESFGGSATPETVASVERRLGARAPSRLALDQAISKGLVRRVNVMPTYLKGIRACVNLKIIRQSRLRVLVDPMHGAGDSLVEQLLAGGRCRVQTLHANPDPTFGGQAPEPIGSHLGELSRLLKRGGWDLGLATDGDADRIGVMGPDGTFITPGQVLCVLLDHLIASRKETGAVVKTISNTSMINRLAQARGLILHEVPVGFKHIAKLMLTGGVLIGGEESGGIGVRGYLPERDGVFIGLLLLEAMATQDRRLPQMLRDLERRYGKWAYARRDLTVPQEQISRFFDRMTQQPPANMGGIPVADVKTLDGVKLIGRDESWLLFRRSGTEPIVRVYSESPRAGAVKRLLDFGVQLLQRA